MLWWSRYLRAQGKGYVARVEQRDDDRETATAERKLTATSVTAAANERHGDGSVVFASNKQPASSSTASYSNSLSTPLSRSSGSTSLTFDDMAVPMDDSASTYIISPTYGTYSYTSSTNGTWWKEAATAVKTPMKTAKQLGNTLKRKRDNVMNVRKIKRRFKGLKEDVQDAVNIRVNDAMQGHDMQAILSPYVEPIARLRKPTAVELGKTFDHVTDMLQAMLKWRDEPSESPTDRNMDGIEFLFANIIASRALKELVMQGICDGHMVMPARHNLNWQLRLRFVLVEVIAHIDLAMQVHLFLDTQDEHDVRYSVEELFGMEPVWVAQVDKACWTLRLETGLYEIGENEDGELDDWPACLETGFALPENMCRARVEDFCRRSRPTECDDLEMVDNAEATSVVEWCST
ncbi:hypothetical protein N0V90_000318 [Kalmusia sp. IMI 367209]|nr:hypothetical protein N0V90_000318 [Kalmusia sp. IMI 367209]